MFGNALNDCQGVCQPLLGPSREPAEPLAEPPPKIKGPKTTFEMPELVGLAAIPTLVFAMVCHLFAHLYHSEPWIVPAMLIFGLLAILVETQRSNSYRQNPWRLILAVACLLAIVGASCVGLVTYDHFLARYWFSYDSNSYTNVLPSQPAAGFADAGKILFAEESRVAANMAVGYKDGAVFCVAPIVDESPAGPVQFWAVGVDCCSSRGGFTCDDTWDSKARAGVVIGNFPALRDEWHPEYLLAVKQAEAIFELTSAPEPVFVRWVVNPEKVEENLWNVAMGIFLVATVVQLITVSSVACFLNSALRKIGNPTSGIVY